MKIELNRTLVGTLLLTILIVSGCVTDNPMDNLSSNNSVYDKQNGNIVSHVEVIHFHGTHQCYTCRTVGAYAEETINTYFADDLSSGKITFQHINLELPENREIVMKYGVKSSSLWIGTYAESGFYPEENVNVWYKIQDKEGYMNYLKEIIEKRLSGDFG
jgi:hypothetical protein